MYRRVFVKGPMSSTCVIVALVGAQQMAQMRLAKDDHVVQAFAANGPNQSFGKTVLPRRARRDRLSRMPIARRRCLTTEPKTRSRSRIRSLGADSQGNASVIWRAIQSAVGLFVAAIQTSSRRSSRTMMKP